MAPTRARIASGVNNSSDVSIRNLVTCRHNEVVSWLVTYSLIRCDRALGKSPQFLEEWLVPFDVADDLPRPIHTPRLRIHVPQLGVLSQCHEHESHESEHVQMELDIGRF